MGSQTVQFNFETEGNPSGERIKISATAVNQFAVSGQWLKGECHCHLEGWEDCAYELYSNLNFDFVVTHSSRDGGDLLTVPGYEVKTGRESPYGTGGFLTHFVAIGVEKKISADAYDVNPLTQTLALLREVNREQGVSILTHPLYTGWSWDAMEKICESGLHGMEILNGGCLGDKGDTGRADQVWSLLMGNGRNLIAIGSGDTKESSKYRAGRAWTGVLALSRSSEEVVKAINQGRTYASHGPVLNSLTLESDGRCTVECSPCVACHIKPARGGFKGKSVFPPSGNNVSCEFSFELSELIYKHVSTTKAEKHHEAVILILEEEGGGRAILSPLCLDLEFQLV